MKHTTNFFANKDRAMIIIIFITLFISTTCYYMQSDILRHAAHRDDVNPARYNLVQLISFILQLNIALVFGRLGDVAGSKVILCISFLSAVLSYFILAFSKSIYVKFISRGPMIFFHTMLGSQMVIADISNSENRIDLMGKLEACYGSGIVLGRILSRWCAGHMSEQMNAAMGGVGTLLCLILLVVYMPKSTKKNLLPNFIGEDQKSIFGVFNFKKFWSVLLRNSDFRNLLIIKTLSSLPIIVFQSNIYSIVYFKFELDEPKDATLLLNYVVGISVITQGLVVGNLMRRGFKESSLISTCLGLLSLAFADLGWFVRGVLDFSVIVVPLMIANSVISTVTLGKAIGTVPYADTGTFLGFHMALFSITQLVAPLIGEYVLRNSFSAIGVFGCVVNALIYSFVATRPNEPLYEIRIAAKNP